MIFVFLHLCSAFDSSKNPLFKKQYFIKNDGTFFNGIQGEDLNVVPAWQKNATGEGVHIVVINDGCQANHSELIDNFDFNLSYNYQTNISDPSYDPRQFIIGTGTKLATIAAGADNEFCGIGIAYKSKISCINVLVGDQAQLKYQEGIKRDSDVKRSIRLFPSFSQSISGLIYLQPFDENTEKSFDQKEAIYVTYVQQGSAQTNEDYNYLFYPSNPYILTFSEISQRGGRIVTSLRGNSVLASVVTGGGDYDSDTALLSAYISTGDGFGKICSETILPTYTGGSMASGVISLILSSTEEPLKSNDISVIIALTSVKNDPYSTTWETNKKGIRYSPIYGFGRLDADAAVTMAKTYRHKERSNPEIATFVSNNKNSLPVSFPSFLSGFVDVELHLADSKINYIDFVELVMQFSNEASDYSLFRIFLRSPMGTERLVKDVALIQEPTLHRYRITARDFFGESASGTWTVRFLRENVGSPNYMLEEIHLIVNGYGETDFPSQTDKEGSNPFQTYKTADAKLTIQTSQTVQTEIPQIQCNSLFNFKVESEGNSTIDYGSVPFDLVLTKSDDKGPFERFGLGPINNVNPAAVYCMYKGGQYKLRAVNPALQVATNDITVELINQGDDDYSDTGFGEIQQYQTIKLTFASYSYTMVPVNIIRNVRKTLSNFKAGYFVLATLWNTETGESFGTQMTESIGGYYVYTGKDQCIKCVLTAVPLESDELVGSECNTFVNTLSIVDDTAVTYNKSMNSKFEIDWNDVCPVPKGIITKNKPSSEPEPVTTAEPLSPTAEPLSPTTEPLSPTTEPITATDTVAPTTEPFTEIPSASPSVSHQPSHNKFSTKIIIIISVASVIAVGILIAVLCCILVKRKNRSQYMAEQIYSQSFLLQ